MVMDKSVNSSGQKAKREFVGVVTSDKMDKTRIVEVMRLVRHSKYTKIIRNKLNFKVHDEKNESHVGDKVRIQETRPISKDKRFRLTEIVAKTNIAKGEI